MRQYLILAHTTMKYIFHMDSHIAIYLICLHLYNGIRVTALIDMKSISESKPGSAEINETLRRSPALSWERDLESGPTSLENENRHLKSYSWEQDPDYGAASAVAENKGKKQPKNDVSHKGKQRPHAKIEFIDEDSQESDNIKPYFRMQETHNEDKQMDNPPDKNEVQAPKINVTRIVHQQKKVPDVARAHSRESYLHSQAFVASKSRLNKPRSLSQDKVQSLSIDAGGIQDVVTHRPRKGFDQVNQQLSLKMQSTEESIEDVQKPNNNEKPYHDKEEKHHDKYEDKNKIEKPYHDKEEKHHDKYEDKNKNNNNYENPYHDNKHQNNNYKHDFKNENQNYLPRDKRYEVQNEINKLKAESYAYSDANKKKVEKQNENSKLRIQSLSDSDEYHGGKKEKQKQLSQKDWDGITKNKKQVNKGRHSIKSKLTRLRPDRGRSRYEGDYGYRGDNSGRNRERYGSKARSDQSQESSYQSQRESDYSREKPKHDNNKKVINEVSDKHEVHDKYKNFDKKDKSNLRVTKGFHDKEVHNESVHDKYKSKSYESIEMRSEENSDFQEDDKIVSRTHPTVHPKLHDDVQLKPNRKPASELVEKEVFQPYSIAKQLDGLKNKMSNYAIIDQEIIGRTVEYNQIVLWKMKEKPEETVNFRASKKKIRFADEPPAKKIIFIVHGLTVMGWHRLDCLSKIKRFETLIKYYIENLDSYDIYLIPMANPDGVAKSLVSQPWNKNVSPQNACPGVNLDRNFDVGWNETYTAGNRTSCRQAYPGPHPFSEHETRAIREVFHRFGHKIVAYLHVHAGTYDSGVFKGDAVLYPKGYTNMQTGDDNYVDLKGDIEEGMRNTSFKVISVNVDTLYNWYGKVQGTSVDYASSVYGIPYAMELVMQLYEDDSMVSDEDKREKHSALTEIWQVVLDVMFDSIYKHAIKPDEI